MMSSQPTLSKVLNQFPTEILTYRIAIIGEAPGELEEAYGKPFVGPAGKMLGHILSEARLRRETVFIGNLAQVRPKDNDFSQLSIEDRESGVRRLASDLEKFDPHIVILLGNHPLQAAGININISSYRGTVFRCMDETSPFFKRKCIATFHPASLLHGSYSNLPVMVADVERGVEEARFPEVIVSQKHYELDLSASEIIHRLEEIEKSPDVLVSFDIEGGIGRFPCCSVSTDPGSAFIIAFESTSESGSRYSFDEELMITEALSRMLYNPAVKKCLQNSLYDRFVLAYRYKMLIRSVTEDTMLKHWELLCEFEKGLAFQASYYTKEPYYKSERKAQTDKEFWTYCCKDSAITLEICQKQTALFEDPRSSDHYRFNLQLLNLFLYLELRGIKYDSALAATKIADLRKQVFAQQHLINAAILGMDYLDDLKIEESVLIKRRGPIRCKEDFIDNCRAPFKAIGERIYELFRRGYDGDLSNSEMGELSMLAEIHFNCESANQKKKYLYETRKFERVHDRKTGNLTSNYEALLTIAKKTKDPIVQLIINQTSLLTRLQMLGIRPDSDGRIRCGYNVVGTETGRITCYTSPTGSGYNLQTIPQQDRDLYMADEGKWMFQCDLSGADAWTVAAWCAKMGDDTMLDDLLSGIKIAKVVALMFLKGPDMSRLPREELKKITNEIKKDDPIYFGSKCVQHLTNYDGSAQTASATIFTQSEGKVNIPTKECRELQEFYNLRYPGLQRWKNYSQNVLLHIGRITSASGHTRIFYGNRRDHHTFKQFLAHEAQANTTYVTNLAALRMWKDIENRSPDSRLIIEPLHQVHDALLGQFPRSKTEWACRQIGAYFYNPIHIAGRSVVIPFEGAFGPSWGQLSEGVITP